VILRGIVEGLIRASILPACMGFSCSRFTNSGNLVSLWKSLVGELGQGHRDARGAASIPQSWFSRELELRNDLPTCWDVPLPIPQLSSPSVRVLLPRSFQAHFLGPFLQTEDFWPCPSCVVEVCWLCSFKILFAKELSSTAFLETRDPISIFSLGP
jgi:hypothetical protein